MDRKDPVSNWQAFWLVFLSVAGTTAVLLLAGPALPVATYAASRPAEWWSALGTCLAAFTALAIWGYEKRDAAARRENEAKIVAHWLRPSTTELLFAVNAAARFLIKDTATLNNLMTEAVADDVSNRHRIRALAGTLVMHAAFDEKVELLSILPAHLGGDLAHALASVATLRETLTNFPETISREDAYPYMHMLRDYASQANDRLKHVHDALYDFALSTG